MQSLIFLAYLHKAKTVYGIVSSYKNSDSYPSPLHIKPIMNKNFCSSVDIRGEGNGNPLQCSCLENPRDGGAWWAAVYVVTRSRTRLKWLSIRSSSGHMGIHKYMSLPKGQKMGFLESLSICVHSIQLAASVLLCWITRVYGRTIEWLV